MLLGRGLIRPPLCSQLERGGSDTLPLGSHALIHEVPHSETVDRKGTHGLLSRDADTREDQNKRHPHGASFFSASLPFSPSSPIPQRPISNTKEAHLLFKSASKTRRRVLGL
jgi:hypothetical protein